MQADERNQTNETRDSVSTVEELEIRIEELEEVIAPGRKFNHNETLVEADSSISDSSTDVKLEIEELEAVIAPGKRLNHNETVVLEIEELEPLIAPGLTPNHNETLVEIG